MNACRVVTSIAFGAALALRASAAAAEPEAVGFEVDAPYGCVHDPDIRADVAALGATFRDANLDDRARTFRIEVKHTREIEPHGSSDRVRVRVTGRLIIRDLVFRETVRDLETDSCEEATEKLALFVATALDAAPPRISVTETSSAAPPVRWPEPSPLEERTVIENAPRLGSGGISINGLASSGCTPRARMGNVSVRSRRARASSADPVARVPAAGVLGCMVLVPAALGEDQDALEARQVRARLPS